MTQNLDQICISMVSNKFQKIFEKFSKMADFWPKNAIFSHFSRRDFRCLNFYGKLIGAHPGGPIVLIFATYVPWGIYYSPYVAIWQILIFGRDLGSFVDPEGDLFSPIIGHN